MIEVWKFPALHSQGFLTAQIDGTELWQIRKLVLNQERGSEPWYQHWHWAEESTQPWAQARRGKWLFLPGPGENLAGKAPGWT